MTKTDPDPRSALTPSQAATFDALQDAWGNVEMLLLSGARGSGRSTVLRALCEARNGRMVDAADVMRVLSHGEPDRLEDSLLSLCDAPRGGSVFLDDLETILMVGGYGYADRPFFLVDLFRDVFARLRAREIKLVAVADELYRQMFGDPKTLSAAIAGITANDYAHLLETALGHALPAGDVEKLQSRYSALKPLQILTAARAIRMSAGPPYTIEAFLDELERTGVRSNLELTAAEKRSVSGLVGTEELETELYRTVLLPILDPDYAREIRLKPKRGILLYGPPGTGKTTIGRYLAEKAGASFFLVDGSMIPGEPQFIKQLDSIIAAARANSPSIIFVDDADVLFRNGMAKGLARKFLSALDGLISDAQSRVCYVMTAMDINDMPPALVRSGRLEVWIETRAPDRANRLKMIELFATELTAQLREGDRAELLDATEGFTPADIQGLIGDARSHLAYERYKNRPANSFEAYLIQSANDIRERKAILERLAA